MNTWLSFLSRNAPNTENFDHMANNVLTLYRGEEEEKFTDNSDEREFNEFGGKSEIWVNVNRINSLRSI